MRHQVGVARKGEKNERRVLRDFFCRNDGVGFGIIVLDTLIIVGVDAAGVKYDGSYEFNARTEKIDARIMLTIPPGVLLVQGVPARDEEYSFEFDASFPRETEETPVRVETPVGPVNVVVRYLRGFPD